VLLSLLQLNTHSAEQRCHQAALIIPEQQGRDVPAAQHTCISRRHWLLSAAARGAGLCQVDQQVGRQRVSGLPLQGLRQVSQGGRHHSGGQVGGALREGA